MSFLELLKKYGGLLLKYGPETQELAQEAIAAIYDLYDQFGPRAIELFSRILADLNNDGPSLLSVDVLAADFPDLAEWCDGYANGPSAAERGRIFKLILEFIKNNPELIEIIIGLLGEAKADG